MFSKNLNIHSTSYTEIHEHRAPTDESVKLLKEMQEKLEKQIVASFKLQDNLLETQIVISHNPLDWSYVVMSVVKINGKNIYAKTTFEPQEDLRDVALKVRDDMAREIASQMFNSPAADVFYRNLSMIKGP